MEEKILNIISRITKIPLDVLQKNTDDDKLWNSLRHIEIVMTIEEEFNIIFESEDISNCRTINKVIETVKNKLK